MSSSFHSQSERKTVWPNSFTGREDSWGPSPATSRICAEKDSLTRVTGKEGSWVMRAKFVGVHGFAQRRQSDTIPRERLVRPEGLMLAAGFIWDLNGRSSKWVKEAVGGTHIIFNSSLLLCRITRLSYVCWLTFIFGSRSRTRNMIFKCDNMVFSATMVTFQMTLLMKKWTNIVMDDGWVHICWSKPYVLLSATCDEILSWMIEIWMEESLGKWQ